MRLVGRMTGQAAPTSFFWLDCFATEADHYSPSLFGASEKDVALVIGSVYFSLTSVISLLVQPGIQMARQLSSNNTSSASLASTSAFSQFHEDPRAWTGSPRISNPTTSPAAHNYAYLMTASPTAGRRPSMVDYRPITKTARGHVPACLVNASVTYYGNDQIYAFGGFDQFTDEGL